MNITVINGTASPAHARSDDDICGQMRKTVQRADGTSVGVQTRGWKMRRGHKQQPKERPSSTVASSNVKAHTHQRRWSVGSFVVVVKKNRKEPQPPQRGVSLLCSPTASRSSSKRYSCPPLGIPTFPSQSASSSSSSTSSCSSPPPVQTSVITGHDPLGWKLQPKSSSGSNRMRNKRLSLQIPFPVVPDFNSPTPEMSPKTKPPLKPKPPGRRHSESSASLASLGNPLPVMKPEELMAVCLRKVVLSDESDDVFGEEAERQGRATDLHRKIPPPVPEKTAMATQVAQLISHSRQRCKPVTPISIHTREVKPKPKHSQQNVHRNNINATKMAELHLSIICDRERSTPRFPG
ncbi:uncharacterized protein LOC133419502 [Cololabis saira]|uniref:uncharacterized protein LOC133419502 n=1 Tax=Cololabis saira TaxID=129043 RepID=UPI002AD52868|nr:uncharacterized protein LOC133419502 [Cololabis saira]